MARNQYYLEDDEKSFVEINEASSYTKFIIKLRSNKEIQ